MLGQLDFNGREVTAISLQIVGGFDALALQPESTDDLPRSEDTYDIMLRVIIEDEINGPRFDGEGIGKRPFQRIYTARIIKPSVILGTRTRRESREDRQLRA